MASITKTFTEQAAPGDASDELFVRPGGSFTWSSVGTIDAGVEVALQWSEQPGVWRDIKRWTAGVVSATGTVLNESAGPRRFRFDARVPTTDPATILTSYAVSATEVADVLEETRAPDGTSIFKITEEGIETPKVTATAATLSTVTVVNGVITVPGGSVQHPAVNVAGSIAEGYGATASEGMQVAVMEETISFASNEAMYKEMTAQLPANSIVLSVQANIQSALTGGGNTTKVGIGSASDPDLYGKTAALTKNAKIDHLPAAVAVIATATTVRVSACQDGGTEGTTALTVGSVRVRIVYRALVSLTNAA
jgi:hypothetical protein